MLLSCVHLRFKEFQIIPVCVGHISRVNSLFQPCYSQYDDQKYWSIHSYNYTDQQAFSIWQWKCNKLYSAQNKVTMHVNNIFSLCHHPVPYVNLSGWTQCCNAFLSSLTRWIFTFVKDFLCAVNCCCIGRCYCCWVVWCHACVLPGWKAIHLKQ